MELVPRNVAEDVSVVYVFMLEQELFNCKIQKTQLKTKAYWLYMFCKVQRYQFQASLDQGAHVIVTDLLLLPVVFILKWLFPSWWQRWFWSSKFSSQTHQLEPHLFLIICSPRYSIDFHWPSWGHMPMSDKWQLGKVTALIGEA